MPEKRTELPLPYCTENLIGLHAEVGMLQHGWDKEKCLVHVRIKQ